MGIMTSKCFFQVFDKQIHEFIKKINLYHTAEDNERIRRALLFHSFSRDQQPLLPRFQTYSN